MSLKERPNIVALGKLVCLAWCVNKQSDLPSSFKAATLGVQ